MRRPSRSLQVGNLQMVIIIVISVLVLSVLGFVLYQTLVLKKPITNPAPHVSQASSVLTQATSKVVFNGVTYVLEYPTNWSTTTTSSNANQATTTVTNGMHTISVVLTISDMPPSEQCNVNDGLTITDYDVQSDINQRLIVGTPLSLVESIADRNGEGYMYTIGLAPDGGEVHAAVGQTHCNIASVGQVSSVIYANNGVTITSPSITANIHFPKLDIGNNPGAPDMQTIKSLLKTEDYKTAVKILGSIRKQ